jgi:RNA polymerase sigma factor (sigma-70 family)
VAAVRGGDDRAFERLYRRYNRRIGAYVGSMVSDHGRAEDVTQDVFLAALRRIRATEQAIAFKPWVFEIARNACIDHFRRTRRVAEVSLEAGADEAARLPARAPTPDAAVDAKQRLDDLCGAFVGLSDTHHQILVMRELEGLSYAQIGERLGVSRASVESTLFRARKRLSEEYEELVSGERCRKVRGLLVTGAGDLGVRDRRKLARHIAHCQPCRRQAHLAGAPVLVPFPAVA